MTHEIQRKPDPIPYFVHAVMHAAGARRNNERIEQNRQFPRSGASITSLRDPDHDLEWMNYGRNKNGRFSDRNYVGHYDKIMAACLR